MPEFFQTMMGRRFYESDVPRLIDALSQLEKHFCINEIKGTAVSFSLNQELYRPVAIIGRQEHISEDGSVRRYFIVRELHLMNGAENLLIDEECLFKEGESITDMRLGSAKKIQWDLSHLPILYVVDK